LFEQNRPLQKPTETFWHGCENVRFIATTDIVAIAANPQSVVLKTAKPSSLSRTSCHCSDVWQLFCGQRRRLGGRQHPLQSQRLGEEARKLIDAQRRQAEKVVERFQWIGAGVVSVMPLVDLLATAAVNAQMVVEMAESTVVN